MASLDSHTQTGYTELDDISAKDSFFRNPDLMEETFFHLKDDDKYGCLLNAALTCKDFLDVALDAIWEVLNSLVPLLKLLPALQVEEESRSYVCANVYVFLYDLILSLGPEWECFSGRLG